MESVGNLIYFVSNRGLKAISSEGQVDDVSGMNQILNDQWLGSVSTVQMAYDAPTMCLYTLKPTSGGISNGLISADGHAACMWFSTSCMTELYDLPFKYVRGGSWLNTTTGTLERRSIFFKKKSNTQWGVYLPTTTRTGLNVNLLGESVGQLGTIEEDNGAFSINGGNAPYGCAGYVLYSPTGESAVGKRFLISDLENAGLANGDIVSLAPVYMQWTGANIGASQDPNMDGYKEFFRTKQISSCRAYVEYNTSEYPIIDADTSSVNPFWMCKLFRGANHLNTSDHTPVDNAPLAGPAFPGSLSNAGASVTCFDPVTDPESIPAAPFGKHGVMYSSLSPSWICFWPGADVTLLAFSAKGKILDTEKRFL
jgi:hypothetical protein